MDKYFWKWTMAILLFIGAINIGQSQTFGVRAGINYNTLNGPTIPGESNGFSNGFHFGMSYGYHISDLITLRFEVAYIQNGGSYKYKGDSFYIVRTSDETVYEKGSIDMKLDNSLGYLSLPVVVSGKIGDKWEINGGAYMNFLVSPIGNGELLFSSYDRPDKFQFIQSMDYRYNEDVILGGRSGRIDPIVDIGDQKISLYKFAGAYHQYAEKDGNLFNGFDAGLTAGIDYFINRGFYIGFSADYGLIDLTNNKVDYYRDALNEDNSFRFSDDKDTNLGLKVSIGFRF